METRIERGVKHRKIALHRRNRTSNRPETILGVATRLNGNITRRKRMTGRSLWANGLLLF
jgi:hypothetical protein